MRNMLVMALVSLVPAMPVQAATFKACQFSPVNEQSTRSAVHAQYGQPDRVTGDPLSIDVYEVTDGGEVWIGWVDEGDNQRFLYIQHVGGELDHPLACN